MGNSFGEMVYIDHLSIVRRQYAPSAKPLKLRASKELGMFVCYATTNERQNGNLFTQGETIIIYYFLIDN